MLSLLVTLISLSEAIGVWSETRPRSVLGSKKGFPSLTWPPRSRGVPRWWGRNGPELFALILTTTSIDVRFQRLSPFLTSLSEAQPPFQIGEKGLFAFSRSISAGRCDWLRGRWSTQSRVGRQRKRGILAFSSGFVRLCVLVFHISVHVLKTQSSLAHRLTKTHEECAPT